MLSNTQLFNSKLNSNCLFIYSNIFTYSISSGGECWCGNSYGKYNKLDDETDCNWNCDGDASQMCGGFYANDVYLLDSPCFTDPAPCGLGAYCGLDDKNNPVCSCPINKPGDPKVRCCNSINCGCWGDPQ